MRNNLNDTVIKYGYCIGCGICSVGNSEQHKIKLDKYGMYQAQSVNAGDDANSFLCLSSDNSKNEDDISKEIFGKQNLKNDKLLGYYKELYFGYDQSNQNRIASSSGGLTTWLSNELLQNGYVDGIIHPKLNSTSDVYLKYGISETQLSIESGRKSYYYPVEMSEVLELIKNDKSKKKYAVVGLPCFITNLRLLCQNSEHFNSKIIFFIGINCGHLKSTRFGEFLAWQNKIKPNEITKIDFREKIQNKPAGKYSLKIDFKKKSTKGQILTKPANEHYGYDWGLGMFKYKACDYCDDIFAETADVVFGDAWINPYMKDWKGTNIVIVRNFIISKILHDGRKRGSLKLFDASVDSILSTQTASIRHRRVGLQIRLQNSTDAWKPTKRVSPGLSDNKKMNKIHLAREKLRKKSHWSFAIAQKLNAIIFFKLLMYPYIIRYYYAYQGLKYFIPNLILKTANYLIKRN